MRTIELTTAIRDDFHVCMYVTYILLHSTVVLYSSIGPSFILTAY